MDTVELKRLCELYVRAEENVVGTPDWELALEHAEVPVARAFMMTKHFPEECDDLEVGSMPLEDVVDNCIHTDWLVYANDEQKADVLAKLDEAIAEHTKESTPSA